MNERKYNLLIEKYGEMEYKELRERYLELYKFRNDSDQEIVSEFYLVQIELKSRERAKKELLRKDPKKVVHEAVVWCIRKYKYLKKSGNRNINQRGIAREAVAKFFPELSGNKRAKMIANLRIAYLKKVL